MLTDPDRRLAGRDPAVPGLPVVLDPDALADWLRAHWPDGRRGGRLNGRRNGRRGDRPEDRPPPDTVAVGYVRYKPRTGLVAAVELTWPDQVRAGFVKAVAPRSAPKLAKLRGATVDDDLLLAYADAVDDRWLPGLAAVLAGVDGVRTLRYKPERRWVGTAGRRLVKVHRPPLSPATVLHHRAVQATGLPVPELLEARPRHGLVAYRWLDGEPLDQHAAAGGRLREVGELLRRLHDSTVRPGRERPPHHLDLIGAVRAVAAVHPEAAETARVVARAVPAALADADGTRVPVHGDFSADQVIVGPAGLTLVDLDRMCADDPGVDLAGWAAAEIVAGRASAGAGAAEVLGELLAGYRPEPALLTRLDALTAAALLRRATEPFRSRIGGWPRLVAEHVDWAYRLVAT